jgi:hypothetical protein
LAQLPNEMYYSILESLGKVDKTQQASLAILNLALSGYGDSKFVSAWCDRKAEADLTALNSLEQMNLLPRQNTAEQDLPFCAKVQQEFVPHAIIEPLDRNEMSFSTSVSVMPVRPVILQRFPTRGEKFISTAGLKWLPPN